MSRVVLIAVFIGGGTIAFIAGIIGYAYSSTGQAVAAEQENIRAEGPCYNHCRIGGKNPQAVRRGECREYVSGRV